MAAVDALTSERMRAVRQRHTKPEVTLRKLLWTLGVRYRCNDRSLPGSPDIVNRNGKWAVFVHGCFWHGHDGCRKATVPKRNTAFWLEKISTNRERDRRKADALRELGLEVVTVWQCQIEAMTKGGWSYAPPDLVNLLRRLDRLPDPFPPVEG